MSATKAPKTSAGSSGGWLDSFGRRHPRLTTAAVVLLAIVVTIVLLYHDAAPAVVYEGF